MAENTISKIITYMRLLFPDAKITKFNNVFCISTANANQCEKVEGILRTYIDDLPCDFTVTNKLLKMAEDATSVGVIPSMQQCKFDRINSNNELIRAIQCITLLLSDACIEVIDAMVLDQTTKLFMIVVTDYVQPIDDFLYDIYFTFHVIDGETQGVPRGVTFTSSDKHIQPVYSFTDITHVGGFRNGTL